MSKTYRDKKRHNLKVKDILDYTDKEWNDWWNLNMPTKEFKKFRKRIRKAKGKQALKNKDYENIPLFKKSDEWDWW
jgi:hypothetical protein